ncbi:MAG: InlB B-repeat-containing protein [Clostridia bacterium]
MYGNMAARTRPSFSISPSQAPSQSSVIYTVECRVDGTKNAYTLRFDTNGGSEIREQRYLEGSALMQPTDPTREGYTFAGWYADKGCTKAFDFGAGMPEKDTTVYAKWNANTYTITFATSTGTAPGAREIKYGEPYGDLPVLTDSTLRFMGWFTQQTGGTQVTADTVFTGTGNQTLYAHWEQKSKFRIVGSPSRRGRKIMMNRNRASRRVHRQRAGRRPERRGLYRHLSLGKGRLRMDRGCAGQCRRLSGKAEPGDG